MKIAFTMNTPHQVHLFKNAIKILSEKGHETLIVTRDYGCSIELLNEFNFEYIIFGKSSSSSFSTILKLPYYDLKVYRLLKKFKADIEVGSALYGHSAALMGIPSICFRDGDATNITDILYKPATIICTPALFRKDLGSKHIRYSGYQELAYLHPDFFKHNDEIFNYLGINRDDPFVVLRFNAFDAKSHDMGKKGFSIDEKINLVQILEEFAHVFISPESKMPPQISDNVLKIPASKIHDVLYYAQLLICDTQTMATEAAILGTPVIRSNSWVGEKDMTNFIELENKYNLIYNHKDYEDVVKSATKILTTQGIKREWQNKREILLKDKISTTKFMVWLIENYPKSIQILKSDHKIQEHFFR